MSDIQRGAVYREIESIMRQDYPKEEMEVLFVDGMSLDRRRAIIAGYLPRCLKINSK